MRLLGVGKRYGSKQVLTDVDLEPAPGATTAITGGNGSGKSTLLRIMVGVSRPTSGRIEGRPAVVGYVPERFPVHERLTARTYLAHMSRLRGLTTEDAVRHWLERLDLIGGADTPLRRLSKGNAQKVALAQALLVRPGLLVLDEPWSGLDSSAHGILREVMTEVAEAGGAVVFTDHRESVVRSTASTVYRIDRGRVRLDVQLTKPARVILRGTSATDWTALDGVVDARTDNDRTTLHVTGDHIDRVLRTALEAGCSVVRVEAGGT